MKTRCFCCQGPKMKEVADPAMLNPQKPWLWNIYFQFKHDIDKAQETHYEDFYMPQEEQIELHNHWIAVADNKLKKQDKKLPNFLNEPACHINAWSGTAVLQKA